MPTITIGRFSVTQSGEALVYQYKNSPLTLVSEGIDVELHKRVLVYREESPVSLKILQSYRTKIEDEMSAKAQDSDGKYLLKALHSRVVKRISWWEDGAHETLAKLQSYPVQIQGFLESQIIRIYFWTAVLLSLFCVITGLTVSFQAPFAFLSILAVSLYEAAVIARWYKSRVKS